MISYLEGTVLMVEDSALVVLQGGVGFKVAVPTSVLEQTHVGKSIALFTHLIVREDLLALYGFEETDQLSMFQLMLGVNGVGPRLALAIVSGLSVDVIRAAVVQEKAEVFNRVPGVGKTTAQKILLYLKGKIKASDGMANVAHLDQDTEVLSALTSLGYSVVEAQAAIQFVGKQAADDIEERIKLALQYFN